MSRATSPTAACLISTITSMSLNSTFVRHGTGLCILSLDSGGSRGLSQLKILAEMMHRLNFDSATHEIKRPCDVFDMIGGAGSGGFIAILLAVVELSPSDALDEFISLNVNILDKQGIDPQVRTTTLNSHISKLLAKYELNPGLRLLDSKNGSKKCKLAVPISYKGHVGSTCMIRNFSIRREQALDLTIAEALSATLATPPLFTSTSIFKDAANLEYIGADWTLSNPIQEIIAEAHATFGTDKRVACLLSLGCGHPGVFSTPGLSDSTEWTKFLQNLASDADRKAQGIDSQMGHLGLYYRFSVGYGLETTNLHNNFGPGDIVTHAKVYLDDGPVSRRIDLCIEMVRMRDGSISLDQLKHSGGKTVLSPHLPPITNSFIMRKEPWDFIRRVTLGPRDPRNTDGPRMLLVTGIGGCGKTQLMLKFMKVHENDFSLQFFIDGSSEDRIRSDIIRNVRALGGEHSQKGFDECLAFLSQPSSTTSRLLLYDNVDDPNLDLSPLLPQDDSCTIVITSRNRSLGALYPEYHLQLDIMAVEEAVSLLLHRHIPFTDHDQNDARELAEVLGFLPIALQQARSYMQQTKCSIRAYIERLSSHRHSLLAQSIKQQVNMREISTYAAFETSFSKLGIYAQDFLRLLAHFYRNGFPLELVSIAAKNNFSKYQFQLTFLERGDDFYLGKELLESIFLRNGTWDITNLDQMVVALQNYSLVTVFTGIDTSLLQLHPLVQDWVLSYAVAMDKQKYQSASVLLLALGARWDHTAAIPHLGSHVRHMTPLWDHIHLEDAMAFGDILRDNTMFEGALHLHEKVAREAKACLGENDQRVSSILWELANTYLRCGRLKQAGALQERILQVYKETRGSGDLNTSMATNNLAYTYYELGRLKEAEILQAEVLKMRKKMLGEHHIDTLMAANNLAFTYRSLGRLKEAETMQLENIQLYKEVRGERHPDTINASHHLANTYRDQGRLEEALSIQEQVLKLRQEVQGKHHLESILAYTDLAIILQRLGRLDDAYSLSTEAIRLGVEILGQRHHYVFQASCSLAAIYRDQGRFKEAETLQLETLHSMRESLGERHFKTTEATLALAKIYISLQRADTALDLVKRVKGIISKELGTDHPQYVECQRIKADALNVDGAHKKLTSPQHEAATNVEFASSSSKPDRKSHWYTKLTSRKHYNKSRDVSKD